MWPFPKTLVNWREPKAFVETVCESEERRVRPWARPLGILALILMMLFVWYLSRFNPSKTPAPLPGCLAMGLFLGIFLVYVMPAISRRCPSDVAISKDCIVRVRGNEQLRRELGKIESYSWVSDRDFFTLVVNAKGQRPALYGVPDADTKATVEAALASLGIQQAKDVAASDAGPDAPSL